MNAMEDLENLLNCLDSYPERPLETHGADTWKKRIAEGLPAMPGEEFPDGLAADLLSFLVERLENVPLEASLAGSIVSSNLGGLGTDWEATGISAERGTLYAHLACQQALKLHAATIESCVSLSDWPESTCPICGSPPFLAHLAKGDGRRMLVCGACMTEWRFRRIGCVTCGETEPAKLHILTADSLPGWSLYYCQSCGGLLKTADLRQIAVKPDWRQATLATMMLDYAAQKWLSQAHPA